MDSIIAMVMMLFTLAQHQTCNLLPDLRSFSSDGIVANGHKGQEVKGRCDDSEVRPVVCAKRSCRTVDGRIVDEVSREFSEFKSDSMF